MAIIADAQIDTLRVPAALLGLPTPLSHLALPIDATEPVLAIVTARLGTLSADTAPGATVRGSGTAMLWMSGTAAQVNAKLGTLTYTGGALGTDTLSIARIGAGGQLTTLAQTALSVVPLASLAGSNSPVVEIDHGTLTLDTRVIDGPALAFSEPAGSVTATTAILINTTIGAHSALSVRNDNAAGHAMPRLAIAGRVELDGQTSLTGNGAAVLLAQGASLVNEGSMTIGAQAARFSGAGTLVNDGSITIDGSLPGADAGSPAVRIDTAIAGSGQISLVAGASLSLGGPVSATETVQLGAGDNTLHLTQAGTFAGLITDFSRGDAIVLDGVSVTATSLRVDAESGSRTLSLLDGNTTVGSIRFGALDAGSRLELSTDETGNAAIRLATVATPTASTTDVFRFFDATHGTQLLTQDRAERDEILTARPDLRYEGTAFQAIDPASADPAAAAVFRFFDTSNGTHFMTASVTERDTLISSRPDLVFEPGSTMFEHATAQVGDVAVYRFFDGTSGAHFFTADAGERATLLSTRPDMIAEGIVFYAPTR